MPVRTFTIVTTFCKLPVSDSVYVSAEIDGDCFYLNQLSYYNEEFFTIPGSVCYVNMLSEGDKLVVLEALVKEWNMYRSDKKELNKCSAIMGR